MTNADACITATDTIMTLTNTGMTSTDNFMTLSRDKCGFAVEAVSNCVLFSHK